MSATTEETVSWTHAYVIQVSLAEIVKEVSIAIACMSLAVLNIVILNGLYIRSLPPINYLIRVDSQKSRS